MSEKMTSQNELTEIKLVPYQTPFQNGDITNPISAREDQT